MSTETFDRSRLLLSMEYGSSVFRDELLAILHRLECLSADEAEHLIATAGEDERGFAVRDRNVFFDALCGRIDEFLADDEGGYYRMLVHVTRYERSAAALEIWFQVTKPGFEMNGTWIRKMVVGVDADHVYADIG